MSEALVDRLRQLRLQGRAALEPADPDAARAAIDAALGAGTADDAPQSAAVARELLGIATDLFALGAPPSLEALFNAALARVNGAPDATLGLVLTLWFNLASLYDAHGAGQLRQRLVDQIGQVATHYAGPLDRECAEVFRRLAQVAEQSGNAAFVSTLYAQLNRYWTEDPSVTDAERADFLFEYMNTSQRAGRNTEALAASAAAAAERTGAHGKRAIALFWLAQMQGQRGDRGAARATLEATLDALGAAGAADSETAAVVCHKLAAMQLDEPPGPADRRAATLMDQAIRIETQLGQASGRGFAASLHQRAMLAERLGDWRTAASCQERMTTLADLPAAEVTEALSRAGRAWHRLGAWGNASRCYLQAVQRRTTAPPAPPTEG